ncbi:MAG: hypothetical protein JNM27_07675 [Leptospirales bacterium]|nr:hypothetical protein [Leptospirales bacterium]
MIKGVNEILSQFKQDDYSVKICSNLFSVVPFAPPFQFYNSMDGAASRLGNAGALAQANQIAGTEDVQKAVWVADALDTSDKLIAGYAGVKNLLSLFSDTPKARTFESDPQQATDAALKALGLAYMIYRLFPGSVTEKAKHFLEVPAGQEVGLYFAVAEVTLPFADNVAEGGAGLVQKLVSKHKGDIESKFASFAGGDQVKNAVSMLESLVKPLDEYVSKAKQYANPVADKIKQYLPSAMNLADSATGVMATGVDLMPIWSFLGGRLAAEACVYRASKGL